MNSSISNAFSSFDLSWTITAVIAIAAFLSPIFVAIINNHHSRLMRKMDIKHEEKLKDIDAHLELSKKQFDVYYADKKNAFSNFLLNAGKFSASKQNPISYSEVHSSLHCALLFCNAETQILLTEFLKYVDSTAYGTPSSPSIREEYSSYLNGIALQLSKDLASTKPAINCE